MIRMFMSIETNNKCRITDSYNLPSSSVLLSVLVEVVVLLFRLKNDPRFDAAVIGGLTSGVFPIMSPFSSDSEKDSIR